MTRRVAVLVAALAWVGCVVCTIGSAKCTAARTVLERRARRARGRSAAVRAQRRPVDRASVRHFGLDPATHERRRGRRSRVHHDAGRRGARAGGHLVAGSITPMGRAGIGVGIREGARRSEIGTADATQANAADGAVGHVRARRREPAAPRAYVRAARHCRRDASEDAARAGLRAGGGEGRRRRGGDSVDARQRDPARRGHGSSSGRCLPSSRATLPSTLPSARARRTRTRHARSSRASRRPQRPRRSPRRGSSGEGAGVSRDAACVRAGRVGAPLDGARLSTATVPSSKPKA